MSDEEKYPGLREAIEDANRLIYKKRYRNADYLAVGLGTFRKMVKEKFPNDETARQFLSNLPPGIGDDGIVIIDKNGLRLMVDQ